MFVNHSKLFQDINRLWPVVNQLTCTSDSVAAPDCTGSPVRSGEEKLTGVLIILSILALILTF